MTTGSDPTTSTTTTTLPPTTTTTTLAPTTTTTLPPTTTTTTVPKRSQTISVDAINGTWRYNSAITLGASTTSGLDVHVDASGACQVTTLALLTVKATDVGPCLLRFNQAGDSQWLAAPEVTRTVSTAKAIPTISGFHSGTLEKPLGDTFSLLLRAGAEGAPVVYASLTGPEQFGWRCDLADNTLTLNGRGSLPKDCQITASIVASRLYEAVTASATITIAPSNVHMRVSGEQLNGNVKTLTISFVAPVALLIPQSDCASIMISPAFPGVGATYSVTATFTADPCNFSIGANLDLFTSAASVRISRSFPAVVNG